jgi:hypothetical protein
VQAEYVATRFAEEKRTYVYHFVRRFASDLAIGVHSFPCSRRINPPFTYTGGNFSNLALRARPQNGLTDGLR